MSFLVRLRNKFWGRFCAGFCVAAALLLVVAALERVGNVNAAGGPENNAEYRVLAPIQSGNLLLFPVVRANSKPAGITPFLTLDEGLKDGSVEVTEAGKVRGLVRNRGNGPAVWNEHTSDQVNTLVLVNNSDKPLLLLAGEVVTGGKQDRVIAKDRIVPAGGDPIDLSVFCIEPGRWIESSANFGASANMPTASFMVQPRSARTGHGRQESTAGMELSARDDISHRRSAVPCGRSRDERCSARNHQLCEGHAE